MTREQKAKERAKLIEEQRKKDREILEEHSRRLEALRAQQKEAEATTIALKEN